MQQHTLLILGVADLAGRFATTPKRGQMIALLLPFAAFYDDYANILITGNSLKSLLNDISLSVSLNFWGFFAQLYFERESFVFDRGATILLEEPQTSPLRTY